MGKPEAAKCPNCTTKKGEPLAMHRLYIKSEGGWKGVGWFCPQCKHIEIRE